MELGVLEDTEVDQELEQGVADVVRDLKREDLLLEKLDDRFNAVLLLDVVHQMLEGCHKAYVEWDVVNEVGEFVLILEEVLCLDDFGDFLEGYF